MATFISGLFDSVVVALLHAAEVADPSGGHVIFKAVSISRHTLRNRVISMWYNNFIRFCYSGVERELC